MLIFSIERKLFFHFSHSQTELLNIRDVEELVSLSTKTFLWIQEGHRYCLKLITVHTLNMGFLISWYKSQECLFGYLISLLMPYLLQRFFFLVYIYFHTSPVLQASLVSLKPHFEQSYNTLWMLSVAPSTVKTLFNMSST